MPPGLVAVPIAGSREDQVAQLKAGAHGESLLDGNDGDDDDDGNRGGRPTSFVGSSPMQRQAALDALLGAAAARR